MSKSLARQRGYEAHVWTIAGKWLDDIGLSSRWARAGLVSAGLLIAWLVLSLQLLGPWGAAIRESLRWGIAGGIIALVVGFTAMSQPVLRPTPKGKLGIWIAPFHNDTAGHHTRLTSQLERLLGEDSSFQEVVEVQKLTTPVQGRAVPEQFDNALELARKVNAAFVVFGEVGGGRLFPRIAINHARERFPQGEVRMEVRLQELERVDGPLLSVDIEGVATLARLLLAFSLYDLGDRGVVSGHPQPQMFARAQSLFEQVAGAHAGLERDVQREVNLEHVTFYLGSAAYWQARTSAAPQPLYVKATEAYESVLRTARDAPLRAITQNNLGIAYRNLAAHVQPVENLGRAVAAYQEALKHRTPQAAPLDYAMTQNNLGNAYADLAAHVQPVENLGRAVAAYQEALKHLTPQAAPLDYAATQNNLGIAYGDLAAHVQPVENLGRAVAAYQEALKHRTPQAAPLDYAGIQNNLGNAYWSLAAHREPVDADPSLRSGQALERAVAAWAVSLALFAREGDGRAAFPARSLRSLRAERGTEALQAIATSALVREALAEHGATAEEALALVERLAKAADKEAPGDTGSSPSLRSGSE